MIIYKKLKFNKKVHKRRFNNKNMGNKIKINNNKLSFRIDINTISLMLTLIISREIVT
jgi:hypothetical protein